MKIYVIGSGKLASAILSSSAFSSFGEMVAWPPKVNLLKDKAVVIHAGSGRQLEECIAFCARTKSICIELSTGLETEHLCPDFPLVICPNTSILMLKTMVVLKEFGHYFKDFTLSITESHQSTKTTEPGTAYAMAHALSFPVTQITSIRNPQVQQEQLGIPMPFINKHAYHKIVMVDGADQVIIETKVFGHDSYVQGVKKIIAAIVAHPLENKTYTILEFIENNWL